MNRPISFIYFDVGGVAVLDYSKTNKWHDMLCYIGVQTSQFEVFSSAYGRYKQPLHFGDIHANEVFEQLAEQFSLNLPSSFDAQQYFVERFEANTSLAALLQKLTQHHRLGLLTNMYSNLLFDLRKNNLLPDVPWEVIIDSTEVRLEKPQTEIYKLAEKEAKVAPEGILFVDNLEENVVAAEALGWQTFLYDPAEPERSTAQLTKQLGV